MKSTDSLLEVKVYRKRAIVSLLSVDITDTIVYHSGLSLEKIQGEQVTLCTCIFLSPNDIVVNLKIFTIIEPEKHQGIGSVLYHKYCSIHGPTCLSPKL